MSHYDSDEDSNENGPFADPYASAHAIASTSWQLRTNLTEKFDKAEKTEEKKQKPKKESKPSVAGKIAKFEQKKPVAVMGKPPRNPLPPRHEKESGDKGKVSVYLRIRPPKSGAGNTIEIIPENPPTKVRTHAPGSSNAAKMSRDQGSKAFQTNSSSVVKEFEFSSVFGPQAENQDVYTKVVAPIVEKMDEGRGGLVFTYGATNSGKTFTTFGPSATKKDGMATDQQNLGIVPRAIADIMKKNSTTGNRLYLSYFELYNENIYDLLDDRSSKNPMFSNETLKLRETQSKNVIVRGLKKFHITSVEEGLKLVAEANSKRQTSSNNLNQNSSRSHCVLSLEVVQKDFGAFNNAKEGPSDGYNTEEEAKQISKLKPTTLSFVDLAGSERNKRTKVGSVRQREASLINKSLMNLMRCLQILRENQSTNCNNQVIPFRESKLTHLFMPVFTGRIDSSISMILAVNPAAADFDETNHVLSCASQAKMVQIEKGAETTNATTSTGEYDYNGRPVKKASAASKLAKLVRKLSPKKLVQRATSKEASKTTISSSFGRKRKQELTLTRTASFSSTTSNGSRDLPKAKKMKVVKSNSASVNQVPKSSTLSDNDSKSLKRALEKAQAEIKRLKADNTKLENDLVQVEEKIRLEVSEEMEAQLESTKRYYTNIINTMKAQSRQSLGLFEKKVREEKAEQQIETLIFKVQEAEDEMQRQSNEYHAELLAKTKEIDRLKQELAAGRSEFVGGDHDEIVKAQQLKIGELQEELAALKKSKTELIKAYEELLAGDEEPMEEDDDDSDEPSDEEDSTPLAKQESSVSRYTTRTRSAQKKAAMTS